MSKLLTFDIPTVSIPSSPPVPTKQAEAQRKYRKKIALKKPPKSLNPIPHPLSNPATTAVPTPPKLRWKYFGVTDIWKLWLPLRIRASLLSKTATITKNDVKVGEVTSENVEGEECVNMGGRVPVVNDSREGSQPELDIQEPGRPLIFLV
ncbi:hypothetical protein VKT23_015307 [Stygiomarasmius scandens]|uniref:Uncharacterized protein n=1 Tax=Marasmiellus scandens TaxID=2682957 RepID=A0ABR1IY72_9AGAR